MFENHEYVNYSFEPSDPGSGAPQGGGMAPDPAPMRDDGKKPGKRRHTALKVTALALSCALVGGAGGGALTAYYLGTGAASNLTETQQPQPAQSDEESVVVSNVVHTNTGDKSLTPQEVYNKYVNSVVGITTSGTTTNVFGQETQFASSGSGFIISSDGYIVTNHHVIADASSIKVSLYDGSSYEVEIVGSDASNDVALLKVEASGLQPVAIGDSDTIAVGDQVAAIGNPLGQLTFSLTAGYVSALDRAINTDGTPINMLQTDAAINSGNSGGPLFDMNGNVIGITTAKYSGSTSSGTTIEGIGFAIPINDVMSIVNDLKTYGYVTGQAYLGISVKELDATTASYYSLPLGVLVADVTAGSCSEKAGLEQGDIITGLDDQTVENYADLAAALKRHRAGDQVSLSIYRAGQTMELEVTLDEKLPETEQETAEQAQQPEEQQRSQGGGFNPFEFFFGN